MDIMAVEELAKTLYICRSMMYPLIFFVVLPLCTAYHVKKINVM